MSRKHPEGFFLSENSSKARLREAEDARKNRAEIVKAYSQGKISRRDLVKWGLITTGGMLAPIHGLNPFVNSAYAASLNGPTGAPPSPGLNGLAFTQPMLRFEVLDRNPITACNPAPTALSNQTPITCAPELGGGLGPMEGRPPGQDWAHQRFNEFAPQVFIEATQEGAKINTKNGQSIHPKFHPNLPDQGPLAMWTFNGTIPPKLAIGRYGEPIIFRHHNQLPADVTKNGGFDATPSPPTNITDTTAQRMTALPAPSSSPNSSTTITGRSSWPVMTASTLTLPTLTPAAPPITAESTRFPATGMRP